MVKGRGECKWLTVWKNVLHFEAHINLFIKGPDCSEVHF